MVSEWGRGAHRHFRVKKLKAKRKSSFAGILGTFTYFQFLLSYHPSRKKCLNGFAKIPRLVPDRIEGPAPSAFRGYANDLQLTVTLLVTLRNVTWYHVVLISATSTIVLVIIAFVVSSLILVVGVICIRRSVGAVVVHRVCSEDAIVFAVHDFSNTVFQELRLYDLWARQNFAPPIQQFLNSGGSTWGEWGWRVPVPPYWMPGPIGPLVGPILTTAYI